MALTFSVAERYLTQSIDLTATPEAVLTNSSTYTRSSLVAAVTAEEISGNGYARPALTVASNQVNADGYGVLTYGTVTIAASGGDIVFDRIALLADGDWVGWYQSGGTTTITDGNSITVSLVFAVGESGAILTGADGQSAYTLTTADFTQPAVSGTVAVSVEDSSWLAVGGYVYFFDGTNSGFYQVSAIGGATSITLTNLGYSGSAVAATVMGLGGQLVASGVAGASSLDVFTGPPAAFTPTESGAVAIRTDVTPNLPYRTTGTGLGNATLIGAYSAFTGLPSAVTPTDTGLFHVRTDTTPNQLFRSTGTGLGNLVEVGGGGSGGSFLEYTIATGAVSAAAGQLAVDGTINGGTVDPITEFYVSETDALIGGDVSIALSNITQNATLKLAGESSGVTAYYRLNTAVDSGTYRTWGVTLIAADGDFTNGEAIFLQILNSATLISDAKSGNFTASSATSTEYPVDCSGGSYTATIPTAASSPGIKHDFTCLFGAGANTLTLARSGSDTFNGATSLVLSAGDALSLRSNGVDAWRIS